MIPEKNILRMTSLHTAFSMNNRLTSYKQLYINQNATARIMKTIFKKILTDVLLMHFCH